MCIVTCTDVVATLMVHVALPRPFCKCRLSLRETTTTKCYVGERMVIVDVVWQFEVRDSTSMYCKHAANIQASLLCICIGGRG